MEANFEKIELKEISLEEDAENDEDILAELSVKKITYDERKLILLVVASVLEGSDSDWEVRFLSGLVWYMEFDVQEEMSRLEPMLSQPALDPTPCFKTLDWQGRSEKARLLLLLLDFSIVHWPKANQGKKAKKGKNMQIEVCGYDARVRVLLRRLAVFLEVPWEYVIAQEHKYATAVRRAVLEGQKDREVSQGKKTKRYFKIGAAAVLGGTLLAVTGGLAAPALAGGIGLLAGSSAGAFIATTAGVAIVTSVFGAAGAGLAGYKMNKRAKDLHEFEFDAVEGSLREGALMVLLTVDGWYREGDFPSNDAQGSKAAASASTLKETPSLPQWEFITQNQRHCELYNLRWETAELLRLGSGFQDFATKQVKGMIAKEVVKQTVFATVAAAFVWPSYLLTAADIIDNPWSVALARAGHAAEALADVLEQRVHGNRPISIVAYSTGARLVFQALEILANRNINVNSSSSSSSSSSSNTKKFTSARSSRGLVFDVLLVGTPVSADAARWASVRTVVSGRLINAFNPSDWVLKFLFRTMQGATSVAGLTTISQEGVESFDIGHIATGGHHEYNSPGKLAEVAKFVNFSY